VERIKLYKGLDMVFEKTYYEPKHFEPYELVSRNIYEKYGDVSLQFFDWRLLWTMDKIRESYGTVIVNDWKWGGNFQYRGYRENKCVVGAKESQHRHGRAIDFNLKTMGAFEFRTQLYTRPDHEAFKYITTIEDFEGMNWIHVDVRNWDKEKNGYLIFGK